MRFPRLFPLVLLASAASGAASIGCYNTGNDCNLYNCGTGGGTGTGTTGGTSVGGTTSSGTTTTTPTGCIPADATGPVADGCGIFVSPKGTDGNPGTKDKPMQTLGAAIHKAKDVGGRVYACAQPFNEAAKIDSDATLFGGLDCDKDWAYVGATKRTTWTADADRVPLRIAAMVNLTMEDVDVTAVDAVMPGGSSIAIIADSGSSLDLARSEVKTGLAVDGMPGANFPGATDGDKGATGADACTAAQAITPSPPTNACADIPSVGGLGGNGTLNSGGPGSPGDPFANQNGGTGQNAVSTCNNGTEGGPGMDGDHGSGASGQGALDADGYTGAAGTSGKPGTPGQGGGGGGGSKGGTGAGKCSDAAKAAGASGGSGGSGGCGGRGGNGGGAGGSSIGIISLGAKLTFQTVKIAVKNGGAGGKGGNGESGGVGAAGGPGGMAPAGLNIGCKGGQGGNGGNGGTGGGGLGGHSVGIAFTGEAPDSKGATILLGTAGSGGAGDGVNDSTKGASGVAKDIQGF